MVWHILNYYDQVKENPVYNFYLYYGDAKTGNETRTRRTYEITKGTRIEPITNKKRLVLVPLDLIVTADLDYEPLRYTKDIVPILYVNHGFHIVSIDNDRKLYAYGERALDDKGRCKFSCILEANMRIANVMNKREPFKGLVMHVGAKDGDIIEREVDNYSMYRKTWHRGRRDFGLCFGPGERKVSSVSWQGVSRSDGQYDRRVTSLFYQSTPGSMSNTTRMSNHGPCAGGVCPKIWIYC